MRISFGQSGMETPSRLVDQMHRFIVSCDYWVDTVMSQNVHKFCKCSKFVNIVIANINSY